ncbi:MAG TPA: Holliday junction resolvase RuvX [Verrucomicrobiae bacterium]|nr:Holliday junction resolvase RuvX [Verrucomicrobiae bacterium]
MRILGVDFGQKRIGLALSDESGTIAQPLEYIDGGGLATVSRELARLCETRKVGKIVVGVPLRLDGKHSEQTERTLAFIAELRRATTIPVAQWDERLTSVQAERALLEGNVRRADRRQKIDKLAAQIMLQSYLDATNPPPAEES